MYPIIAMLAVFAVGADAKDDELKKLEGTWNVVETVEGSRKSSGDEVKGKQLIITGSDFVTKMPDIPDSKGIITIDPSKSPKWIDVAIAQEDGQKLVIKAIYALESDKLTLCHGVTQKEFETRPEKLEAGDKIAYAVLERAKK